MGKQLEDEVSLRQLELVDRIIGLEAEVARLKQEGSLKDIRHVRNSPSWKLGHFILSPFLFLRSALLRLKRVKG